MDGNGMEWNGMEWNGMEWNGMNEWNGMPGQPDALLLKSIDQHLSETPSRLSPPATQQYYYVKWQKHCGKKPQVEQPNVSIVTDFVSASHFSKNVLSEMPVSFSPTGIERHWVWSNWLHKLFYQVN